MFLFFGLGPQTMSGRLAVVSERQVQAEGDSDHRRDQLTWETDLDILSGYYKK